MYYAITCPTWYIIHLGAMIFWQIIFLLIPFDNETSAMIK